MGKMKANRKFIKGEEAVSAVIGVILMVAITVAIAATVYVYVSGMLPSSRSSVPSISLVQNSAATENGWVNFTIDSASADAKWSDLKIMIGPVDFGSPTEVNSTTIATTFDANPTANQIGFNGSGIPIKANGILYLKASATVVKAGVEVAIIHIPSNSRISVKNLY